jgi:hypothetical protein
MMLTTNLNPNQVEAIENFKAVLLGFAAILVFTSAKLLLEDGGEGDEEEDLTDNAIVQFARSMITTVDYYDGPKFFTNVGFRFFGVLRRFGLHLHIPLKNTHTHTGGRRARGDALAARPHLRRAERRRLRRRLRAGRLRRHQGPCLLDGSTVGFCCIHPPHPTF